MRWTTIGLNAAALESADAAPVPARVDRKKQIASVWIPTILAIGLLLSFVYLGIRIAAMRSHAAVAAPVAAVAPVVPKPISAAPVKDLSVKSESSKSGSRPAVKPVSAPVNFTIITPQTGERYIQLAAVTPHMVLSYVDDLRRLNLEPVVVAPGPSAELLRVLVGPFSNAESLEAAKAQLDVAGRKYLVRVY